MTALAAQILARVEAMEADYSKPVRSDGRRAVFQADILRLTAALREVVAEVEIWTHTVCDDPWYTCPAATEEREGGECIRERGGPCDCGRDARAARTLAALASVWDEPGDNT